MPHHMLFSYSGLSLRETTPPTLVANLRKSFIHLKILVKKSFGQLNLILIQICMANPTVKNLIHVVLSETLLIIYSVLMINLW